MLKCKHCLKQLTKYQVSNRQVFCSASCSSLFSNAAKRSRRPKKFCINCNKDITFSVNSYKFCSRSCSASVNNKLKKHTEKTKAKISMSVLASKTPEVLERIKSKQEAWREANPQVNSTNLKKCRVCLRWFDKPTILCSKKCYATDAQRRALSYIGTGRGKKGTYAGIYCQSSYELVFVIWHVDHKVMVKRSTKTVDYSYNGKKRKYRPDFEINGTTYEIKGYEDALSKAKHRAAKSVIENFIILSYEDLKKYINYVCKKYNKIEETTFELYDSGQGCTNRTHIGSLKNCRPTIERTPESKHAGGTAKLALPAGAAPASTV